MSKQHYEYIEGINATEDAYSNISCIMNSLRGSLDMSYTDIEEAMFYLKEIVKVSTEAISVLSQTEEISSQK